MLGHKVGRYPQRAGASWRLQRDHPPASQQWVRRPQDEFPHKASVAGITGNIEVSFGFFRLQQPRLGHFDALQDRRAARFIDVDTHGEIYPLGARVTQKGFGEPEDRIGLGRRNLLEHGGFQILMKHPRHCDPQPAKRREGSSRKR